MKIVYIILALLLIGSTQETWAGEDDYGQTSDTINQTINGKKEGYWIIYAHMRNLPDYKPNDIVEEGKYKSSRKTGIWKAYFPNGKNKSEIEYNNGRAAGKFVTYFKNGQVEEAGTWKGRAYKDEFVRYYEDGTIAQKKTFNETGKTEGVVEYYHPNGQVELTFTTANGVETGTATRFYANGDVKEVITYGEGGTVAKKEEKERVNPPVKLTDEGDEGDGVDAGGETNQGEKITDGYHKTYNENKDILMDGKFKDGKLLDGKHYIYDENGLLERIEVYKNGKYVGNGVL